MHFSVRRKLCLFLPASSVDSKRRLQRVVNALVVNSCKQLEHTWSFLRGPLSEVCSRNTRRCPSSELEGIVQSFQTRRVSPRYESFTVGPQPRDINVSLARDRLQVRRPFADTGPSLRRFMALWCRECLLWRVTGNAPGPRSFDSFSCERQVGLCRS